jgi:trigger factor
MSDETKDAPEADQNAPDADVRTDEQAQAEQAGPEDGLPPVDVDIEDAGTLRKKVAVTVPRERIDAKFNEMFGELGQSAQVPGFRVGHAPRRLIEKRFGREVAEDVRNGVVGEALGQVLEGQELNVLGEPDLDVDAIELPDSGPLSFSFEVEVAPDFDLPEYKGIPLKRPSAEVTDELVDQSLEQFLASRGTFRPVKGPAEEGDMVDVDFKVVGENIEHVESDTELRVRPAQVQGIPLEDLGQALAGTKPGDTRTLKATVPAGHPNENWRDKDVEITIDVKDVKRLESPELDDELARDMGFASAAELREAVRDNLEDRLAEEAQRSMREQACKHLLDAVEFDLPPEASDRHANRLLTRRYVSMMMQGVPREQLDGQISQLQEQAKEEAATDLKLSFILGNIADAEGIQVDEGEVNARVAAMARQQNRRPERLRQELSAEGRMETLVNSLLEEKALDHIVQSAEVTEVKAGDEQAEDKQEPSPSAGGAEDEETGESNE